MNIKTLTPPPPPKKKAISYLFVQLYRSAEFKGFRLIRLMLLFVYQTPALIANFSSKFYHRVRNR